jgi:hypothetical protein
MLIFSFTPDWWRVAWGTAGMDRIMAAILGFLSRKIYLMHVSLIWLQWRVSEGSAGELR